MQERMGLVTRTLLQASSDLFHFMILFFLVFIGYSSVGNILFGHQVEGMSTLSQSCMTLTIMLLNFDTTQFYSNMAHASIGWSLQLFLWSYLVIVFFILLNVSAAKLPPQKRMHEHASLALLPDGFASCCTALPMHVCTHLVPRHVFAQTIGASVT
jgi:hypothetical protein